MCGETEGRKDFTKLKRAFRCVTNAYETCQSRSTPRRDISYLSVGLVAGENYVLTGTENRKPVALPAASHCVTTE
jgi:hypothetical protein